MNIYFIQSSAWSCETEHIVFDCILGSNEDISFNVLNWFELILPHAAWPNFLRPTVFSCFMLPGVLDCFRLFWIDLDCFGLFSMFWIGLNWSCLMLLSHHEQGQTFTVLSCFLAFQIFELCWIDWIVVNCFRLFRIVLDLFELFWIVLDCSRLMLFGPHEYRHHLKRDGEDNCWVLLWGFDAYIYYSDFSTLVFNSSSSSWSSSTWTTWWYWV